MRWKTGLDRRIKTKSNSVGSGNGNNLLIGCAHRERVGSTAVEAQRKTGNYLDLSAPPLDNPYNVGCLFPLERHEIDDSDFSLPCPINRLKDHAFA